MVVAPREWTALSNMDGFHTPNYIQPGVGYRKVLEQRVQGEGANEDMCEMMGYVRLYGTDDGRMQDHEVEDLMHCGRFFCH